MEYSVSNICTKNAGIGQLLLQLSLVVGWYRFFEIQCRNAWQSLACSPIGIALMKLTQLLMGDRQTNIGIIIPTNTSTTPLK